jgi:hypothetical protein
MGDRFESVTRQLSDNSDSLAAGFALRDLLNGTNSAA